MIRMVVSSLVHSRGTRDSRLETGEDGRRDPGIGVIAQPERTGSLPNMFYWSFLEYNNTCIPCTLPMYSSSTER